MLINTICAVLTLILSLWVITAVTLASRGNVSGMARIYLSEILQNIRGSIGNHVYSCWNGLNYIRNKAVSISNPRSLDQQLTRARTSESSKQWYSGQTSAQRALWEEYAQQQGSAAKQTGPNSNGGSGTKCLIPSNGGVMSGFNSFVGVAGQTYNAGTHAMGQFLAAPPLGVDAPDAPTNLTCLYCFDDPVSVIRLAWADPIEAHASSRIRVWIVSLDAGCHKQMVASVALGVETYDVLGAAFALGLIGPVSAHPGHYHIQIDCIGGDGPKSPPSNICQEEITVAQPAACSV